MQPSMPPRQPITLGPQMSMPPPPPPPPKTMPPSSPTPPVQMPPLNVPQPIAQTPKAPTLPPHPHPVQQFEMHIPHDDQPTPAPNPVAPQQVQGQQQPQQAVTQPPVEPQSSQPPIPPAPASVVPVEDPDEPPRHRELKLQPLNNPVVATRPASRQEVQAAAGPVNPSQWFQPGQPVAPVQTIQPPIQPLFSSDSSVGSMLSFSQQQEVRNRRRGIVIAIMLGIALIIIGGGAVAYMVLAARKVNDPQAVFTSMVSKNLATKQVHQSITEGKTGTEIQMDYDVSDVTKPRVFSTVHIGGDSNKTSMKYYSTFQNAFVQYQNTAGGTEAYLNKWIQVRKDGVLEPNSETTLATSFEARRVFFGQMIVGSFNSSDKKSLESAFKDGVYSYDKSKVKTETIGTNKTFVYEVTVNPEKFIAYNQKAAKIVGMNPSDLNKTALQSVTSAMLYVDAASQRLVRVITGDATIQYSNYNGVAVQPQPASQMSWSDFLAASGLSSTTNTTTTDTSANSTDTPTTNGQSASTNSDANFDDPNFDDPLWNGDAGEQ
jgi:hypothetical protein